MSFMTILWSLLLLPICLLLIARKLSDRALLNEGIDDERISRLQIARWFGLFCSIAPIVLMVLSLLPDRWSGNPGVFFRLFFPATALLAFVPAIALFLMSARGAERFFAPLATLLAGSMCMFLLWAALHSA